MNRLRVQLTLAFSLVVFVAVGAIAFLILRTTDTQFRRYVTHSGMTASGSGVEQLVTYYEQEGGWDGVGTLLEQGVFVSGPGRAFMPSPAQPGRSPGGRLDVVLADASGKVVYDSAGNSDGKKLSSGERAQALVLTESGGGSDIGYLLLSLPAGPDRLGRLERQFIDGVQRILTIGGALAVGVSVVLGAILSRRLTAPLQRLAAAARAVAGGDLGHQVQPEGSVEVVEVAQAFNEMTAALGESERQRQNMVADVAHELRTPLTVLQGNLRAILDGVYPASDDEISRLYDETRFLGRVVDDLRELALADAGQLSLNLRPSDIAQVVRSTVESLTPAGELHQVAVLEQLPEDLPLVQIDPDRVAQVLRNLMLNALHNTPPGGSVQVSVQQKYGVAEVSVIDTGNGIAPHHLPHVFERFWRADPSRARTGGSGLGLSVARSLVEAQGGRIWVESVQGEGSVFRFTLPIASE